MNIPQPLAGVGILEFFYKEKVWLEIQPEVRSKAISADRVTARVFFLMASLIILPLPQLLYHHYSFNRLNKDLLCSSSSGRAVNKPTRECYESHYLQDSFVPSSLCTHCNRNRFWHGQSGRKNQGHWFSLTSGSGDCTISSAPTSWEGPSNKGEKQ